MKLIIRRKPRSRLRLFAMVMVIGLLFTALLFSPQAIESDSYLNPLWDWNPGTPQNPLYHHMRFFDEGTIPADITNRGIQLLRAGMAFPDGRRIDASGNVIRTGANVVHPTINCACHNSNYNVNLRGNMFRGFHGYHSVLRGGVWGRNNYIAAFSLITMIANASGDTSNLVNPGLTDGAFINIVSRFTSEGIRCGGCGPGFITWENVMEINGLGVAYRAQDATGQRSFRRHFIWGIALHALTDTFEHSIIVRDYTTGAGWYMMNNANNNKDLAVSLSWNAAQAAFNEALAVVARPSGHAHRHGCYRVFLAAGNQNLFTGNFRMANLLDYAMENRAALIAANLNPA